MVFFNTTIIVTQNPNNIRDIWAINSKGVILCRRKVDTSSYDETVGGSIYQYARVQIYHPNKQKVNKTVPKQSLDALYLQMKFMFEPDIILNLPNKL